MLYHAGWELGSQGQDSCSLKLPSVISPDRDNGIKQEFLPSFCIRGFHVFLV
uniref:Uncharacterized protein n=1 Tax=Anguilla anguilla TaxID=7936 RepID=A0A0E9W8C3_ANGAN